MNKKKISELSEEILDVLLLTETVRDACMGVDNSSHALVLDMIIRKQQMIYDKIEIWEHEIIAGVC